MKGIHIKLKNDLKKHRDGSPYYKGEIHIGDYKETIFVEVNYWNLEDYKKQWLEGLKRIKTHSSSMLVVSVRNPQRDPKLPSPSFERWALHKIDEKIFVRPGILFNPFLDTLPFKGPFTLQTWPEFITPRRDNPKADEWVVDLADLEYSNIAR